MSDGIKLLTLDLETSPSVAHVWGLWDQTVSLSQLRETTRVISFAAKWYGQPKVIFRSEFHDGRETMILEAHRLLSEADAVIHFNGSKFDIPHLKREFAQAGMPPPAPFQEIDLLKVVKRNFRFLSNKLQHVSTELGLEGKVQHTGHDLWVRCMAGDEKAWGLMRRYNKQDTVLTEELYDRLLPWINSHPHSGLFVDDDNPRCARCGSERLQRRGYAFTNLSKFRRYQCQGCGSWSRGGKRVAGVDVRGES